MPRILSFGLLCLVSTLAVHAQTAPPSTDLQLWVKADAGVVTNSTGLVEKWTDQSGKNNDALQGDDTLKPMLVVNSSSGLPALHFDGTDDYLNVTTAPGLDIVGDIASFAVIRVDDYANYNSIWGKTAVNIPAPTDWYLIKGSGVPQLFRGDGGGSFANVAGQRPVRTNSYVVVGIRQSGTSVTHYLNGSINGEGELTATPADAGTDLKIGSRDNFETLMKGDIAELLIYSSALTDAEVNTAMNYLRNKYGITNTPPVVSISTPANNATFAAPATVNVTVNASDPDGVVNRVSLLANGTTLATATAAPFTFAFTVSTPGTVNLTAVATDDRDATATSTNISLTITGTPVDLATNSHLKVWLRADAGTTVAASGAVTAWADQSGNGNDALQPDELSGPTVTNLNSKPALQFDGADYLDIADSETVSLTGDLALFYVARFDDFGGFRAIAAKTSGNQPQPFDYYVSQNSGVPNFLRGFVTNDTDNISQSVSAARAVPAKVPVVLGVQQAGTNVTHFQNGAPSGTGVITLTPQDLDTPLKIGSRDDLGTRMKGQIAELLIYDAALSSNELANVQQYLATKYDVPSVSLSNNAPAVQITAPVGGTNLAANSPVTITATASDPGGSVTRVDFFANGLAIGSDTTAPYTATFSSAFSGPVTLTATATDNLGAKTTGIAVVINITGGQTAPVPIAGLALWLRPDQGIVTNSAGAVTQWKDSSGNGNDAVQNDPAKAPLLTPNSVNGLPTLNFDGANSQLEVASSPSVAITGDISSFFVVNFADYDTYRAVWAKTAGNLPAANDYYLASGSGFPVFYHGNSAGTIAQVTGTEAVPTGTFLTAGFELASGTATHYLNGAENGSGSLTAQGADAGGTLYIGTRSDFVTRFKGEFAEVLIYARALSDTERAQIESYFQAKYFGQQTAQPSLSVTAGSNNTLVFSWPESVTDFVLEASNNLGPAAAWTAVTEPVVPANGQNTVTVANTGTARFFRLRK